MEKTIAEQIQGLGLGKWMPGALVGSNDKCLEILLPVELGDRFANGSLIRAVPLSDMLMIRITVDSVGSRAHPCKSLGRDAPEMIQLSKSTALMSDVLPRFGRTPCEYAVTPAEVVLRVYHCDMRKLIPRRRETTTPRVMDKINKGSAGRSDYLTPDEQAIKAGGLDLNAANAVAEKLAQDWREGPGAPVAEAWNKTNGVSDVTLLRSAVRTINAAKDARGGSLTLQLSDDGHLIVLLTETTTIR